MTVPLQNLIGWTGAFLVLTSLISSSLMYKRWLGLAAAVLFGVYAWETSLMPLLTASVLIFLVYAWQLFQLYTTQVREYFQRFPVSPDNAYLKLFLEFHKAELSQIYPTYSLPNNGKMICFFILRNLIPAGVFIASEMEPHVLYIHVDFAIPPYRDYKIARFMFDQQAGFFLEQGYTSLWTVSRQIRHTRYLYKMGFKARSIEGRVYYVKNLEPATPAAAPGNQPAESSATVPGS